MDSRTPPPATTPKRPAETNLEESPRSGMISRVIGFFSSAKKRRKTETSGMAVADISRPSDAHNDFGQEAHLPIGASTVSSPNAEQTEHFIDALSYSSTSPIATFNSIDTKKKNSGILELPKGANAPFNVGSSGTSSALRSRRSKSGLTQSSFRKARFSSGTKFHTKQAIHTPSTVRVTGNGFGGKNVNPSGRGVYHKGTPYRRQKLQFQTSSDMTSTTADTGIDASAALTTPSRSFQPKKRYATTPYNVNGSRKSDQMQTPLSTTASAPIAKPAIDTPNRSFHRQFQKRYRPASNTLLRAATPSSFSNKYLSKSKLRVGSTPKLELAESQRHIIIKQLAKQTRSPSSRLMSGSGSNDGGLFRDPSTSTENKIQRVGMKRVLGSNQDGSRLVLGNGTDDSAGGGEEIRSRRESAKSGAFTGEARVGDNYWSDNTTFPNNTEQPNGAKNTGVILYNQTSMITTPDKKQDLTNQKDDSNDHLQAIKRKKVTFDRTPPGQNVSLGFPMAKDKTTPVDVMPIQKAPPPSKLPPKRYVRSSRKENEESQIIRNDDGTIEYPTEMVYGSILSYGSKNDVGIEVSDVTDIVMNRNVTNIEYSFRATAADIQDVGKIASAKKAANGVCSPIPYSFMPKDTGSNRKGSSSILNKSLKSLKEDSVSLSNAGESVPTSSPVPSSSGWGNLFPRKPGEWKCEACLVSNPKDAAQCLSCEKAKAGATENGNTASSNDSKGVNSSANINAPKFSFGAPSSSSTDAVSSAASSGTKFSFGAPTSSSKDTSSSTSNSVPKISFGAPETSSKGANNSVTSSVPKFSFGGPTSSKDNSSVTSSSPRFSFGAPITSCKDPPASASSLSFGAPKDNQIKSEASDKINFGVIPPSTEKTDTTTPGFSFGTAAPSTDETNGEAKTSSSALMPSSTSKEVSEGNKPKSSFSFGAASPAVSKEKSSEPIFQFGSKTSVTVKKTSHDPKPAITFGSIPSSAKTDSVVPVSKFGISEAGAMSSAKKKRSQDSQDEQTAKPKFSFGKTSSAVAPTIAPIASFSFGASKDTIDSAEAAPKPAFAFGSGTDNSTSSSSTAFAFGTSTSTPAPAAKTSSAASVSGSGAPPFSFGSSSSTVTPAISTGAKFTFGSSAPAPAPTESVPAKTEAPAFSFGSIAPATAAISSGLSFGQQSSSATAPAPPASSGSTFAFGSTPASSVPTAGGSSFTFGNNSSAPAPMTFPPVPSTAPSFGGGAPPAPSAPAFGFGQQAPAAAPTSSFGFGGTPAPVAPVTQFGGPTPASAAPNFTAATQPMGGGFAIGTGGGTKTTRGRRIVRAKRPPSNK